MHYLLFVVGAVGMLMSTRSVYNRFERWNRSRRLRGAKECLDAVHNTLADLAKGNPKARCHAARN
jgi:hypothetical protein